MKSFVHSLTLSSEGWRFSSFNVVSHFKWILFSFFCEEVCIIVGSLYNGINRKFSNDYYRFPFALPVKRNKVSLKSVNWVDERIYVDCSTVKWLILILMRMTWSDSQAILKQTFSYWLENDDIIMSPGSSVENLEKNIFSIQILNLKINWTKMKREIIFRKIATFFPV